MVKDIITMLFQLPSLTRKNVLREIFYLNPDKVNKIYLDRNSISNYLLDSTTNHGIIISNSYVALRLMFSGKFEHRIKENLREDPKDNNEKIP